MIKIIKNVFQYIECYSKKLRISLPKIQIANAYFLKSEMCDTAANY